MAASIVMRACRVRVCVRLRPEEVGVHISRRLDLLEGRQRGRFEKGGLVGEEELTRR